VRETPVAQMELRGSTVRLYSSEPRLRLLRPITYLINKVVLQLKFRWRRIAVPADLLGSISLIVSAACGVVAGTHAGGILGGILGGTLFAIAAAIFLPMIRLFSKKTRKTVNQ